MESASAEQWRILLVDDDEEDYLMTKHMLQRAESIRIALDWASSFQKGKQMLQSCPYHAILVDYDLGVENGIQFITEAVEKGCSAPLILYTGRGGYEIDVEAMRSGATMYITKREANPLLLERFIRYAIERKRIERALLESEARFRASIESMQEAFAVLSAARAPATDDRPGKIIDFCYEYINQRGCQDIGKPYEELAGQRCFAIPPRFYRAENFERMVRVAESRQPDEFEDVYYLEESCGEQCITAAYEVRANPLGDGLVVTWHDVTNRKRAEEVIRTSQEQLRQYTANLEIAHVETENEKRLLEAVMEALPVGMAITDEQGGSVRHNKMYDAVWRGPRPVPDSVSDYAAYKAWWVDSGKPVAPEEWASAQAVQQAKTVLGQFMRIQRFDGSAAYVINSAAPVRDFAGRVVGSAVSIQDITELWNTEQALQRSEEKYRMLFNTMLNGFALHEIICDEHGKPVDYRFLEVNQAFEQLTGLTAADIVGKTVREVLPGIEDHWIETYGQVALMGTPMLFENFAAALGKHYQVHAFRPQPNQFATLFLDISERIESEQELKQINAALETYADHLRESNQALEDFAFIASHDLREPLRKVQVFGEVLKSQYGMVLEGQGLNYVERMQQASVRMQSMLDGLLDYSRVATRGKPFARVDLNWVVADVKADLEIRIAQAGGQIEAQQLPVIDSDPLQMQQLFQNLLGNALKFHREGVPPQVKISARQLSPSQVELRIADNGTGFDMKFASRLFQPFRRLVGKSSYEGTGMGLAICRKIVERHGGSISVTSVPGEGSTFIVTLPAYQA